MSAREEAIEAAARAVTERLRAFFASPPSLSGQVGWGMRPDEIASVALAAAVPVLLNDLADRIEADSNFTMPNAAAEWNGALHHAAEHLRAAAEGWGDR